MIFSRMVGKYAMVYRQMTGINQFQANSVPLDDWNDIFIYFNLWTNGKTSTHFCVETTGMIEHKLYINGYWMVSYKLQMCMT